MLAILLLHAGQVVPIDRLIDELRSGDLPDTAGNVLQVDLGQLRKVLESDRARSDATELTATRPRGHILQIGPTGSTSNGAHPSRNGARGAGQGSRNCRPAGARGAGVVARTALRGCGVASVGVEVARLKELRVTALESRIEVRIVFLTTDL